MPYVDSMRVFVRVVELGSITAGGRDLRLTPAVASNRIRELEGRLGVRLLNRTTRKLTPTEVGRSYYEHARKVLDALAEAEAAVSGYAGIPRGVIRASAPLGVGRTLIAPLIPAFTEAWPETEIRLRLSDRLVNPLDEGIDVAFFLGTLKDSALTWRQIADLDRVMVAAPAYLKAHGQPQAPADLVEHNCLLLRYPRSPEYFWTLQTKAGPQKMTVSGKFDADSSEVLVDWALAGKGIANRPRVEVERYLASGALVPVLTRTPPLPSQFGCLYAHRLLQDAKMRLFIDHAIRECRRVIGGIAEVEGVGG